MLIQCGTSLLAGGCQAAARFTSLQAQPAEEHAGSKVQSWERALTPALALVTSCAPPSLPSFGKKVLGCCSYETDLSLFCVTLSIISSAGSAPCTAPLPAGKPGALQSAASLPPLQGRLGDHTQPSDDGQGHRAHFACQCEHAPQRIFAGTFISLILNIPSECLSTISLRRLLYLLINLTDKRLSPISIPTSFSLNYIPIP